MDNDRIEDGVSTRVPEVDTAEQPALEEAGEPEADGSTGRRRVALMVAAGLGVVIVAVAAVVVLGGDDGPGTTDDVVASGGDPSDSDDGADSEGTADVEAEDDGAGQDAPAAEAEESPDAEQAEAGDASTSGSDGDTEFADTNDTEWGAFSQGSPEAVVATFYDAVQAGDCEQIVDLWTQSYVEQLGETRQEQVAACGDFFAFDQAPEYDPDSIRVISETSTTAVVSVDLTSQGSTDTAEMHLVMEAGWKIDLLGGVE